MNVAEEKFTGRWLHHREWNGTEFSHELAEYHHDEHTGADGAPAMRHALVEREGTQIAVGFLPFGPQSKPERRLRATDKLRIAIRRFVRTKTQSIAWQGNKIGWLR